MFQKKTLVNGAYSVLDKVVVALFGMIYVIYFARILPKVEFGILTIVLSVNILGVIFCDLAVGQALIHYGAGKEKSAFSKVFFNGLLLKFLLFVLTWFVIIILANLISGFFNNAGLARAVRLISPLILTTFLYNTCVQMMNTKEKVHKMFCIDLFWLCTLAVGIYLAGKYELISNARTAVIFLIVVRIIALLFAVIFVVNEVHIKGVLKIDTNIIRKIYVFAKYSFANSLGTFVFSKTDIFMLAFMLSSTHVAIYASAVVVTNFFRLLNEPANVLVLPMVSKLYHQKTANLNQAIRQIFFTTSFITLLISIPISVVLLFYPHLFLQIFYVSRYNEAVTLVRLFALWGLIMPFYRCAAIIFNGVSRPQINAKYTWLAGIANVLLNIPLIYYLQTNGAAIASIVTSFILLLVFLYTLQTMFHLFCFVPECSRNIVKAVDRKRG